MERSSSETISVHHYLYSILESYLVDKKPVLQVGFESLKAQAMWTQDTLSDGTFVLAEGEIRLIDFGAMASALTGLPTIMQAWSKLQQDSLKQSLKDGSLTQQDYNSQLQQLKRDLPEMKQFAGVTEIIRALYGDARRLRLYPIDQPETNYFAANLSAVHMQRERAEVLGASGLTSAGTWRLFGILDRFKPASGVSLSNNQNLENIMQGLLEQFSQVGKFTLSVEWPVVSVIPIAVYQLLASR